LFIPLREEFALVTASCVDLPQHHDAAKVQYVSTATSWRHEMTPNIGTFDRILRIVFGLGLIAFALGYIFPGTGWNWAGWIGAVPLLTAVFGTCPAYSLLGMTTCSAKQS
jgi:Protein of unknown function (DUF2892)